MKEKTEYLIRPALNARLIILQSITIIIYTHGIEFYSNIRLITDWIVFSGPFGKVFSHLLHIDGMDNCNELPFYIVKLQSNITL